MGRDKINRELRSKLGISERQYQAIIVNQLRNHEPVEDAQTADVFEVEISTKPYVAAESYWGQNGLVEESSAKHIDVVRITETGDYLEQMKRLAFGFVGRIKYGKRNF